MAVLAYPKQDEIEPGHVARCGMKKGTDVILVHPRGDERVSLVDGDGVHVPCGYGDRVEQRLFDHTEVASAIFVGDQTFVGEEDMYLLPIDRPANPCDLGIETYGRVSP